MLVVAGWLGGKMSSTSGESPPTIVELKKGLSVEAERIISEVFPRMIMHYTRIINVSAGRRGTGGRRVL